MRVIGVSDYESTLGSAQVRTTLVVDVLRLGPLFTVFLQSLLVLVELTLLGDEGIQHRQSLLVLRILIVVAA